ncbi:MAG: hypothetical protein J6Y94_00035 [Bacteriovoracaceae bacterium]|nr:hypothetical protein [Bacteriovoracaceae bacterium]
MTKRSFITKVLLGSVLAFPAFGFSTAEVPSNSCSTLFSYIVQKSALNKIHAFDGDQLVFYSKTKFLNNQGQERLSYTHRLAVNDILKESKIAEEQLEFILEYPSPALNRLNRERFIDRILQADRQAYNSLAIIEDLQNALQTKTAKINYGVNDPDYLTITFKSRITEDPAAEVSLSWKKESLTGGTSIDPANAPVREDFGDDIASFIKAQNDFYRHLPQNTIERYQWALRKMADDLFATIDVQREHIDQIAARAYYEYFSPQTAPNTDLTPDEKFLRDIFDAPAKQYYQKNASRQIDEKTDDKIDGYILRIQKMNDQINIEEDMASATNVTGPRQSYGVQGPENILNEIQKYQETEASIDRMIYGSMSEAETQQVQQDADQLLKRLQDEHALTEIELDDFKEEIAKQNFLADFIY